MTYPPLWSRVTAPPAGSGTRGNESTWLPMEIRPNTIQATPPRNTASGARYQTAPGLVSAGRLVWLIVHGWLLLGGHLRADGYGVSAKRGQTRRQLTVSRLPGPSRAAVLRDLIMDRRPAVTNCRRNCGWPPPTPKPTLVATRDTANRRWRSCGGASPASGADWLGRSAPLPARPRRRLGGRAHGRCHRPGRRWRGCRA